MTTLLLAAVHSPWVQTSITFAANHLVLVVLARQSHKRRLNDATAKPEDKVKGGFLLNVVIGQGPSIFQLLPSENQTLLIRWNTFLVLNLGLDIVDGVTALNLEGYGLPR